MPEYNGEIPEIGDIEVDEPTTEAPSEEITDEVESEKETQEVETTTEAEGNESQLDEENGKNNRGVPIWLVVIITVAGMGVGYASCYVFLRKKFKA